jgi:DnaJ family protein B protein 4
MSNYYEILGVSKDATEDEIKKEYRRLSLKFHPDRNPSPDATEKMKEINTAYNILSNNETRQRYNMEIGGIGSGSPFPFMHHFNGNGGRGENIFFHHTTSMEGNGGPQMEFANLNNIFNMMFQGGEMNEDNMFQQHIFEQINKPPPIVHKIQISLKQAYEGCNISLEIVKWVLTNGIRINQSETISFNIPEGIDDNEIIILREKGNIISHSLKGDVKIVVSIQNTEGIFERNGIDLILKTQITLKHALCGGSYNFIHLNGKSYTINTSQIIHPEQKQVMPNLGIKKNEMVGSLIVIFDVIFPKALSKDVVLKLREIL